LGKPIDLVKKDIVDKFIGKGMLGIYDISPQDEIMLENGKVMKWDDYNKIKGISNQETFMLAEVENRWIDSGLTPIEFIKTKEFQNSMLDFRNLWIRYVPGAKDLTVADVAYLLGERLANSLGEDISSAQKWYNVQLKRATTPEEIEKLKIEYAKIRQQNLISSINKLSKTSREIYFGQP